GDIGIGAHPLDDLPRSIANRFGASHSLPIMGIDNLPIGSVMLCFNEARLPTDWEYRLGEFGTKIASITIERLRSIENLSESEERLNLALTAADMVTWDADLSTGKTIWSDNNFQIFGYDPATNGAATVEMWLNRVHPDDLPDVMQAWETAQRATAIGWSQVDPDEFAAIQQQWQLCVQTGMPYEAEFCWHFGGESDRWYLTRAEPIRDRSGQIVEWVGTNTDITHLKQVEAALQESQQFVQKVVETMPGMLYVYDLVEQRNIYSNRHSLELLGYTPEQLEELGTDITPNIVHPDDLPSAMAYQAQFDTALPGEVLEIEYRVRQANGEWCWLLSRSTVFNTTPAGNTQQILGVSIDITDRKRAEQELHQSQALVQSLD
ncbi:PAS domain-containing protein, partial [Chamaesiphon sp. VAR_48_metabat_135_sub]|uniref:PAS domain-containing protein n=1 Tax=Chamaesiphon sp. VAR_48_metabat_135_sub TaxID=2964699 RepID=UPI00286B5CC9